jgi:hypothetical protein
MLRAQTPAASPAFEVASIKQNDDGSAPQKFDWQPGGRVTVTAYAIGAESVFGTTLKDQSRLNPSAGALASGPGLPLECGKQGVHAMAPTPQTYKNHARFFPLFHFFVAPVLLLNFLNALRHLYLQPSLSTGWALVVATAFVALALAARLMVLTVQDRVIRLEMRLRMQQTLPSELGARIEELTRPQLVALRFASDAELADLVRDVLAGKLQTQRAIKERVRDWAPDYLRA